MKLHFLTGCHSTLILYPEWCHHFLMSCFKMHMLIWKNLWPQTFHIYIHVRVTLPFLFFKLLNSFLSPSFPPPLSSHPPPSHTHTPHSLPSPLQHSIYINSCWRARFRYTFEFEGKWFEFGIDEPVPEFSFVLIELLERWIDDLINNSFSSLFLFTSTTPIRYRYHHYQPLSSMQTPPPTIAINTETVTITTKHCLNTETLPSLPTFLQRPIPSLPTIAIGTETETIPSLLSIVFIKDICNAVITLISPVISPSVTN